jgi:hypothetical protein
MPADLVDARRRFLDALIIRRLAPNPTSRRDHSDLLQFHFFNQK